MEDVKQDTEIPATDTQKAPTRALIDFNSCLATLDSGKELLTFTAPAGLYNEGVYVPASSFSLAGKENLQLLCKVLLAYFPSEEAPVLDRLSKELEKERMYIIDLQKRCSYQESLIRTSEVLLEAQKDDIAKKAARINELTDVEKTVPEYGWKPT